MKKRQIQNFAGMLHHMSAYSKVFSKLKRKFEFLLTTFAVILLPLALPILPKVKFNFKVILILGDPGGS